ncbi:MAG: DUF2141 domain-containing protein [Flavobacteriaceae bacterium]|nr:DUF2141 domain-containing protein [Flavobacteriaceae bacterium]PHX83722.1 MAG: hypothetical protein CK537_04450 [Flavobacteriales bacterium]
MAPRLLSLLLAFFFLGIPSVESTTLVNNSSLLKVQCAVSTSAWEDRSPKAAWMLSLRSADGKVIEEVLVKAESNPQQLSLGLRNPGQYILATYFDANGNRAMDRGLFGNPTEPYAFSNNVRNRFSEPDLIDQRFAHPGQLQELALKAAF